MKNEYSRVLLKLSGEALLGKQGFGISQDAALDVARAVKGLQDSGLQVAIVIGAGNIFRGIDLHSLGMSQTPADQMGMLATLLNGIALQEAFKAIGTKAAVMSALECPKVVETYQWHRALQHLENNEIVIFVGGTGNPYFTTDTAAALRASEIEADILLKATKVDGVYDRDPKKDPAAVKYETITYSRILNDQLNFMDATSIALCRKNKLPIFVFNMNRLLSEDANELLSDLSHGTLIEEGSQ